MFIYSISDIKLRKSVQAVCTDLYRFSRYNDKYGHQNKKESIEEVARTR